MIYQHPLAYLLGLEGIGLLRAWAGDYEQEFVQAPGLVATYRHTAGDFLRAALPVGFQVGRCEEPRGGIGDETAAPEPEIRLGPWEGWPWSLMDLVPEATRAADGSPATIIWHFQLAAS